MHHGGLARRVAERLKADGASDHAERDESGACRCEVLLHPVPLVCVWLPSVTPGDLIDISNPTYDGN